MTPEAYKKYQIEREQPKPPEHCKGCDWGRWTGVKQVCSVPRCFKAKSQAFRKLARIGRTANGRKRYKLGKSKT